MITSGMPIEAKREMLNRARGTARDVCWSEFDRDGAECAVCGVGEPLEVHHRDGDPLNNHLVNLIAVCERCHNLEHRQRRSVGRVDEWREKFDALGGGTA